MRDRRSIRRLRGTARVIALAGLLLELSASGHEAQAQGSALPLTGELPVNQTTSGGQEQPAVDMRDNGTHFVVWRNPVAVGDFNVQLRRFPGDGTTPFAESNLAQVNGGSQGNPEIDLNSAGNWLAVWTTDLSGQGLRARTSTSGILSSEIQFSEATTGSYFNPRASRAEDGSWIAVWEAASGSSLRRFDAAGAAATGEIPLGASFSQITAPTVAAVADGEAWVVVRSTEISTAALFLEHYDNLGAQIGNSEPISENAATSPFAPEIDAAGDGSFVVVWLDSLLGVQVRCFAADGTPRTSEETVDADVAEARLAVATDGAFVVTWRSSDDIAAREYDRTCRPVGAAFVVNTTTAGTQTGADAGIANDRFVVVWQGPGAGGDGDGNGVARRLFRRRSLYADDFESQDLASWSAVAP